jgi:putative transposase
VPGVAHHVTQRGTDRQTVFHSRADRLTYLHLVREQASLGHVSILAYCLMSNHIHLVAVPEEEAALAEFMQRVQGRCGHLWQNRYNSCALGPRHLWAALRYVELNPVRARLVATPREYAWSSAEAHCSGQDPWRIADMRFWSESGGVEGWQILLSQADDEADAKALRRATHSGQPLGDEGFVQTLRAQRENTRTRRIRAQVLPSEEPLALAAY